MWRGVIRLVVSLFPLCWKKISGLLKVWTWTWEALHTFKKEAAQHNQFRSSHHNPKSDVTKMLWALLGPEHDCFPLSNPPTLLVVKDVNGDQPPDRQRHLVTKIISAPTAGPEADGGFLCLVEQSRAPCSVTLKNKRHELSPCAWVCLCACVYVCVFVCKAYVSSAQGCHELISNETGLSSCRRLTTEINSLFRTRYRLKDL